MFTRGLRSGTVILALYGGMAQSIASTDHPPESCPPTITFDEHGLASGDIVMTQYRESHGMIAYSHRMDGKPLMIFDTSDPTGDDDDLGTPHSDFGGPGIGNGGAAHQPGANRLPEHNILVVNAHPVPPPNDAAGTMYFVFERPVQVNGITVIDIDEGTSWVAAYDAEVGGNILNTGGRPTPIPMLGDNAVAAVQIGAPALVRRLEISIASTGLSRIFFCDEVASGYPRPDSGQARSSTVLDSVGHVRDSVGMDNQSESPAGIPGTTRLRNVMMIFLVAAVSVGAFLLATRKLASQT